MAYDPAMERHLYLLEKDLEAGWEFIILQGLGYFLRPEELTHRDDHLTWPHQHPLCPLFLHKRITYT